MTEKTNFKNKLSSVTIQKIKRNPDGVCLDDSYVQVKNHDIKVCEKLARKIYNEDLR